MPYADPEKQRAFQRAAAARRRAAKAALPVAPSTPVLPADVSNADLVAAGRILGQMKGDTEDWAQYRDRLRAAWAALLRVVG